MRFRVKIVMTAVFLILFVIVGVNFFKISVVDNDKYQDMANNFIQEQTKQLADKISKELGINLAGALGGIGGGIKLSI